MQRGHDARRGFIALHRGGGQHHRRQRVAPLQGVEHVAQRRAGGRGNNANALRPARDGALAGRVEQPLGFQAGFQAQEFLEESAFAGRAQQVGIQLVLPAGLVHADRAVRLDGCAIARHKTQAQGVVAPHHAAQRGLAVFEREIQVARCSPGEVGDLALHPHVLQGFVTFQQLAQIARQVGDGHGGWGEEG